jgi:hypothetical protein
VSWLAAGVLLLKAGVLLLKAWVLWLKAQMIGFEEGSAKRACAKP